MSFDLFKILPDLTLIRHTTVTKGAASEIQPRPGKTGSIDSGVGSTIVRLHEGFLAREFQSRQSRQFHHWERKQ
jgi:hypothetical protein